MAWDKTDVVYLDSDGLCPFAHNEIDIKIAKKVTAVYNFLKEKYKNLEWELYLIGTLKGNTILVEDYEIYPQEVTSVHVQWVEDGIETSYIYEVKAKHPGKIVGNIHSHNVMSPIFKSFEDEENALVEGDFGVIINNKGEVGAWMKKKLPCGAFILLEVPVDLEQTDEVTPIDTSFIQEYKGGAIWDEIPAN